LRVLRRFAGPLRDELGQVVGRIVTVEDITTSVADAAPAPNSQKMESMGRLAGGVAHDFNNLLGSILGFASLLLEQTPASDSRRAELEQIAQAAERASNLTAALLAFSRSARFERTAVSLNRVIEDTYQILRSTLDPSVSIVVSLDPALPPLIGDPLLLQQVVVNLVQELREPLAGGGTLRLMTRAFDQAVPAEDAAVRGPECGAWWSLEVTAGTAETPSRTGEPTRRRGARGPDAAASGLRSRSRRTSPAHTAASCSAGAHARRCRSGGVPGGAPRRNPCHHTGVPRPPGDTNASSSWTTSPDCGRLAKSGLRQRGFDVVSVESGEQALDILRKGEPRVDLVVLDLTMPGLVGREGAARGSAASGPICRC
jgi:hypothetical protein